MLSVDSTGIHILALTIYWSAFFAVLGAWLAAEVAARLAVREGQNPLHVWRGLLWVSACGLIGARLWFVVFPPQSYTDNGITANWLLAHPFELNMGIVALWSGGLGLIGGIAGGIVGLWNYTRRNRLPFAFWLDIAAVVLPLAQTVARLGNGAKQDLYGPPTTFAWGMLVSDKAQRVGPYTDLTLYPLDVTRFHPVYLYELVLCAGIFAVLFTIFIRYRERVKPGAIALLYVAMYGSGRFLLEFMRANVSHVGDVNISQAVVGIAAPLAIIALIQRSRHGGDLQNANLPAQGPEQSLP